MRRVQIEPMPGEPAIAHAGRIAFFLGVSSTQKFDQWLKREWNQSDKSATSSPRLAQLAGVAGMSLVDYARQHSMMGVLRVGARPSEMALHGAPEATNFTKRLGMLTQKKEAFLCPRCVQEDLEHWKFSWFRRTHQLQGVDWCPSHRTPLVKVKGSNPWELLPQHWMEKGEVEEPNLGASDLESNDFVLRFTEIACALLERPGPLHLGRLARLLGDRARELGLRTSQDGVKPNLSDLVLRSAPEGWLICHWPELVDKKPGSFYFGLDNTVSSRTVPSTGFAYATALTALWPTPLQVHQMLTQIDVEDAPTGEKSVKRSIPKDPAFWHGGFWDEYIEQQGRVRAMAPKLGVHPTHLREKFNQLGLPSLHDVGTAPRWRAYLRFEAGESLPAACAAEGVSEAEVLELIRLSCARVANGARQVLKSQASALIEPGRTSAMPAKRNTQKPVSSSESHFCDVEAVEQLSEQAS